MSELAEINKCKLCGKSFAGPRIAIVGNPGARAQALVSKLVEHIGREHPQQMQAIAMDGAAYMGARYLMCFESTDTELLQQKDFVRWQVHQQTLNVRVRDENIKEQCEALADILLHQVFGGAALDNLVAERAAVAALLVETITGLRDELEEPGKYTSNGKLTALASAVASEPSN